MRLLGSLPARYPSRKKNGCTRRCGLQFGEQRAAVLGDAASWRHEAAELSSCGDGTFTQMLLPLYTPTALGTSNRQDVGDDLRTLGGVERADLHQLDVERPAGREQVIQGHAAVKIGSDIRVKNNWDEGGAVGAAGAAGAAAMRARCASTGTRRTNKWAKNLHDNIARLSAIALMQQPAATFQAGPEA